MLLLPLLLLLLLLCLFHSRIMRVIGAETASMRIYNSCIATCWNLFIEESVMGLRAFPKLGLNYLQ